MAARMEKAFAAMSDLEQGAIANPDEKRMVGHYWLRNSALAPTPAIRAEIDETVAAIQTFAKEIHDGNISGAGGSFHSTNSTDGSTGSTPAPGTVNGIAPAPPASINTFQLACCAGIMNYRV